MDVRVRRRLLLPGFPKTGALAGFQLNFFSSDTNNTLLILAAFCTFFRTFGQLFYNEEKWHFFNPPPAEDSVLVGA